MNYSELNLDENLQKGLGEAGYVVCTPVQEQVISNSLDGSDLYVQSQTGTGKTAAYLVSIMQELLAFKGGEENSTAKTALVLVPTRELAVQVEEEAGKLGKFTGLKCASFFGGVSYEKQLANLKNGVDIIIGTPGRIIDLAESKQMDLSAVAFLSIDEADRMFDMGFYPDLRKLINFLPEPEKRQTMLFSATLNTYVKNLAYEYTKDAKEITIEAENITVDEIDQELIHVSSDDKIRLLVGIIQRENPESLIIFCNTKKMCEVLSKRLEINGIKSEFIIGDLPQSKRLKIMDSFKAGKISCLVATDVAARGIDVNDLAMVVNFDLPNEAENYVHRIGRTARAGKSGKAYTFCSEQDVYSLAPIERYIEKQIPSRVAVEEDFGEDLSRDKWIRVGNWRDGGDDRRSSRNDEKSFRDGRRHGRDERRRREKDRRDRRRNRGELNKFRNANVGQTDSDELEKLSAMTSEERFAYYREKYAHSIVSPEEKSGSTKKSKNQRNPEKSCAQKNGGKNKRRSAHVTQNPPKNQRGAVPEKKTQGSEKKLGFFGKLKALFGKK
ncbi:DEAD/DEAH box helicase [Treponema zioleckii]|uniref:DEAD/DEAH box helicase n=1 Tax=Treponema zioleckii TaxID=331680 RepID=UPI00168B3606|nr:DEAD/DEAH box helicase [Treponema zioleckii]